MSDTIVAWVGVIFVAAVAFLGGYLGYCAGYQDGQVDAINGVIKFELVLQKNGTTVWKELK